MVKQSEPLLTKKKKIMEGDLSGNPVTSLDISVDNEANKKKMQVELNNNIF